jgi:hypothetical protein
MADLPSSPSPALGLEVSCWLIQHDIKNCTQKF